MSLESFRQDFPNLRSLYINACHSPTISGLNPPLLELMNKIGVKPHCLKLSSTYTLADSNVLPFIDQHNFIRKLTLTINNFKWINKLSTSLKSVRNLSIKGAYSRHYYTVIDEKSTIYLEEILNTSSDSLDSLRIDRFNVDADVTRRTQQPYDLTRLHIHSHSISSSVYNFINHCLPKLRHRELDYLKITSANIQLENLRLSRLDLHVPPDKYIKITTSMDSRCFFTGYQYNYSEDEKVIDHTCHWDTLHQISPDKAELSDEIICFEFKPVQELYINYLIAR